MFEIIFHMLRSVGQFYCLLVVIKVTTIASACGIQWNLPQNHFDGIDKDGYISYWEKIGEIDDGRGTRFPLHVNFRSDRELVSPFFGYGWMVAFLDSHIIQIDEKTFRLVQPDGWIRNFRRKNVAEVILEGGGGWKAEIRGNGIIAWAPCGWKLTYLRGKIQSFSTPQNDIIQYNYIDNRLSSVTKGGRELLGIQYDTQGKATRLTTSLKTYIIKYGFKKRFLGTREIGMDYGVSQILSEGRQSVLFEYGYTENNTISSLTINKPNGNTRRLCWNTVNKRATQDNDWNYTIASTRGTGINKIDVTIITRRNDVKIESWHWGNGYEFTQNEEGSWNKIEKFISGPFQGKIRYVETLTNGVRSTTTYLYKEGGMLLEKKRILDGGRETLQNYFNDNSSIIIHQLNGKETAKIFLNSQGKTYAIQPNDNN
jgi:hypothetical protein